MGGASASSSFLGSSSRRRVLGSFGVVVGMVGHIKNLPGAQTMSDVVWALGLSLLQ